VRDAQGGIGRLFRTYLASVLTSLGILWLNDRASAPVFVVVAIFVAIVVAIPSGVLWMKQWGHRLPGALGQAAARRRPPAEGDRGSTHAMAGVSRLGRQPGDMDRLC
jgi:hypothetical protein